MRVSPLKWFIIYCKGPILMEIWTDMDKYVTHLVWIHAMFTSIYKLQDTSNITCRSILKQHVGSPRQCTQNTADYYKMELLNMCTVRNNTICYLIAIYSNVYIACDVCYSSFWVTFCSLIFISLYKISITNCCGVHIDLSFSDNAAKCTCQEIQLLWSQQLNVPARKLKCSYPSS